MQESRHRQSGVMRPALEVQPRERADHARLHAGEIRSMDGIDELARAEKLKPKSSWRARCDDTFEGDVDPWSTPTSISGLRQIIDAKIEGREIVTPEVEAPRRSST
jgi:hypothetical protein